LSDARLPRAKRIAASLPQAAASTKHGVSFGMARNLSKPVVTFAAEEFDALSDDEVTARLREAWG
jgi:hypothetical protein